MIKSRFFWVLSAILIIGVLFTIGYRERKVKISPSFQTSSMTGLNLIHKKGSKLEWELFAKKASFPLGSKEVFLDSIELKLNRSPEILLISGNGVYTIDEENILLNNSVELIRGSTKFRTATLKWHSKEDLITTDDPLVINGNQFTIVGRGLKVKVNEENARINNDVKAVIYNQ